MERKPVAAPRAEVIATREPDVPPTGDVPVAVAIPARLRLGFHLEGLLAHGPLAVLFTWPLVLNLGGNGLAPGVMTEDRAQNLWNLWWVKTALLDLHTDPFVTDRLWYPTPVSLRFHTLNIFNGLISIPFQPFMPLPAILSGIVLFSFIMAGWGAYLLVMYVLGRTLAGGTPGALRAGALVGSAAFAYSAYHLATQRGQLQLVSLEWVPFYVLFLLRAVHEGPARLTWRGLRWGYIAAAAFFLVLIALVDWYYVMYVVLFTALYGLYLAGRTWFGGGRTVADVGRAFAPFVSLALIGGLFALVVSPLLIPTIQEARTESYMRPVPGIAFINSADLLTFFLPPLFNQLWGTVSRFRWEWPVGVQLYEVYFGYVALALAGIGLLARRVPPPVAGAGEIRPHPGPLPEGEGVFIRLPSRLFWAAMVVIFWVLALGPTLQVGGVPYAGVPMPYNIIELIPGFNISRSPDRFDMPLTLCLAVLVGYGAVYFGFWILDFGRRLRRTTMTPQSTIRNPQWLGLSLGLVGLMFIELWPAPSAQLPAPIYNYYEQVLAHDPDDYAIVELPPQDDYWHGAFAMYYQTAHHKRIFGGYISREYAHPFMEDTAGFRDLHAGAIPADMFVDTLDARLTALAQYNVRYIVVYKTNISRPTKVVPVDLRRYRALVAQTLGVANPAPVYNDDQLEVYAVPKPAQTVPYLILDDSWYKVEPPDQHRWMRGTSATLKVASPTAVTETLVVEAASFHRPRTLTVSVGDTAVQTLTVGPDVATYRLGPLPLAAGTTTIRLSTPDAGESPAALGVNEDSRLLTFEFRQVRLEP